MRKGWLCPLVLLLSPSTVPAQQYPAAAWSAPAYPAGYAAAPYGHQGYGYPAQYGYYPYPYQQQQAYPVGPNGYPYTYPVGPMVPAQAVANGAAAAQAPGTTAQSGDNVVQVDPNGQPLAATEAAAPESAMPPQDAWPRSPDDEWFTFHRKTNECMWIRAEYLFSHIKPGPQKDPLFTTGASTDPNPGALSPQNGGTSVLIGGRPLDFGLHHGGRVELGLWLDTEDRFSVDVGVLYFAPQTLIFQTASDGNGSPLIARPIFDTSVNEERSYLIAFPQTLIGAGTVEAQSSIWGAELNSRYHSYWNYRVHSEGLLGFRMFHLRENLVIRERITDPNGNSLNYKGVPLAAGDSLAEEDNFEAVNHFYGFTLGSELHIERPWFSLGLMGKVSVGMTEQQAHIRGSNTLFTAAGATSGTGGILTQISNIGDRSRYVFGILPEAGVNLNFNLHKNVRLQTGYSFLFLTSTIRPGDLIDRVVNPGFVAGSEQFGAAGPGRPAFAYREQIFYMHTFNFGLELHY